MDPRRRPGTDAGSSTPVRFAVRTGPATIPTTRAVRAGPRPPGPAHMVPRDIAFFFFDQSRADRREGKAGLARDGEGMGRGPDEWGGA